MPCRLRIESFVRFLRPCKRAVRCTNLRGQLAAFCLRGLADRWTADERAAAEREGRQRTNDDMLERSPAAQFKAQCLGLLDEVEKLQTQLVITKRGRPVARVVPLERATRPRKLGGRILGDIVGSIEPEWIA